MGKKAGPISGTKNGGGGGGVAPKSKQIQKTPRDKAVAGFVQKKSDKFRDKGKKGPQIKKAMKVANVQARAALASGEVSVVNSIVLIDSVRSVVWPLTPSIRLAANIIAENFLLTLLALKIQTGRTRRYSKTTYLNSGTTCSAFLKICGQFQSSKLQFGKQY